MNPADGGAQAVRKPQHGCHRAVIGGLTRAARLSGIIDRSTRPMSVRTWPRTRAEHRELVSYLTRKTGDVHVADDLAQDVIVRLLAFMARVEVVHPRALAFRIADNLTINWARRSRRRLERPLSDNDPAC